jgi:hypothetical protein
MLVGISPSRETTRLLQITEVTSLLLQATASSNAHTIWAIDDQHCDAARWGSKKALKAMATVLQARMM